MIIVFAVYFVALFIVGLIAVGTGSADEESVSGAVITGYFITLLAILAYLVVPVAHWGATPGKRLLNIYILNEQGKRDIGYPRAIGRVLGTIPSGFFYIGYIMVGLRSDKRALHDLIANTYPTVILKR